jgi:hypothetical protein
MTRGSHFLIELQDDDLEIHLLFSFYEIIRKKKISSGAYD